MKPVPIGTVQWFARLMADERADPAGPALDGELRSSLTIGVAVGVPAAVAVGAFLALFRSIFDATNAALILMIGFRGRQWPFDRLEPGCLRHCGA